jgi:hypothetical protein
VKEILFRAAQRREIQVILVANQYIGVPKSRFIQSIQVPRGFDVADNEIVQRVEAGDLVITADIPLASDVIAKGAQALSPRGELYTKNNIGARLNMRDFMDQLRSSGVETGGSPPFNHTDRQAFANRLDQILARN